MTLGRVQDCVFYEDGFCVLTDRQCGKLCNYPMRRYKQLGVHEHLDIWLRARDIRRNYLVKGVVIGMCACSLLVAIVAFVLKMGLK
jgi:hypothetical protein